MKKRKKERRYCTCCTRKFYTDKMKEVYYPLLKKHHWHCQKCLSAFQDNLHLIPHEKDRYLLELFSGSKTVSNTAAGLHQYKTFDIDIEEKYSPKLCTDILTMRLNQIPDRKKVFIVWASVPCTYYTILNLQDHWEKIVFSHRMYYYAPLSSEAKRSMQLLEKTLWLIKSINPVYYFIENPRGALRHLAQMNFCPFRYTVSYSDFGSDIYKPTDIFTNCGFLQLPKIKTAVGRTFENSVQNLNNSYDRSVVPGNLISEILRQIDLHHSLGPS